MKRSCLILFLSFTTAYSQQRVLVTPKDEVIPILNGESALQVARKHGFRENSLTNCGTQFTFGYDENHFPPTSNIGFHHKDVIAEWFIAKASGTMDTIFWENISNLGALDSIVSVRIHQSNIYPGRGPGFGPYPPPCQQWGYYRNTNDLDQGVTPFKEEATDTNWVSTVSSDSASFDPFGKEIWGYGGYKTTIHANKINFVSLDALGAKPTFSTGDAFFISMKINAPNVDPDPLGSRAEFAASGFHVTNTDEMYPSRDWKFYEHDSGPSNCATIPITSIKRGWIARGGFTTDTLDVALYNIWYTMTVTSNAPPKPDSLQYHLSSVDSTTICVDLTDCNPAIPTHSVDTLWVIYTIENGPSDSLVASLDTTNGTYHYCVTFPPTLSGTMICSIMSTHYSDGTVTHGSPHCGTVVTDVKSNKEILPTSFALNQNYPNPFNPTTDIGYQMADFSQVSIKVFDVLGHEVATLVNERKSPGNYSVSWDASTVPSGIYFCRMQTEKFSDVKKMVVMR